MSVTSAARCIVVLFIASSATVALSAGEQYILFGAFVCFSTESSHSRVSLDDGIT